MLVVPKPIMHSVKVLGASTSALITFSANGSVDLLPYFAVL